MLTGVPLSELALLAGAIMVGGVVTGILAGLFGIGGGAIIVPVLYEVFRAIGVPEEVRIQLCIGTSLAIIVPTTIRSYQSHRATGIGVEGIEISPVPPGDLTSTRPGVAHYHVGIDQSCLPAGKNIVKGTPSWVHFGDGKSEIDMQLTPGRHRLALQLGDDLHNTIPGACQMITVTVK